MEAKLGHPIGSQSKEPPSGSAPDWLPDRIPDGFTPNGGSLDLPPQIGAQIRHPRLAHTWGTQDWFLDVADYIGSQMGCLRLTRKWFPDGSTPYWLPDGVSKIGYLIKVSQIGS